MLCLSKSPEARARQKSVLVNGEEHAIRTEFWRWIGYGHLREQERQPPPERYDDFYAGRIPQDRAAGIAELDKFWIDRQLLPRGGKSDVAALDWDAGGEYVFAEFLKTYGIDLETERGMHWHRFLALWHAALLDIGGIIAVRLHKSDDERGEDSYDKAMEKLRDDFWLDGTKPAKRGRKRKR